MKKKLQVFVSSTFTDLKDERQAAVAAILKSGHIPAGMELFTAGDRSQMSIIEKWIDESDVYMLVLGGRYGSLEKTTNLSYTELEYDYAKQQGKAMFAVVITDDALTQKVKKHGPDMLERANPKEMNLFKQKVLNSICSFFVDEKDIRLCVHESLADLSDRKDLKGWVSADALDDARDLHDEVRRLRDENSLLKQAIESAAREKPKVVSVARTKENFVELKKVLAEIQIKIPADLNSEKKEATASLLAIFKQQKEYLITGVTNASGVDEFESFMYHNICPKLQVHGLVENEKIVGVRYRRSFVTKLGNNFLASLEKESILKEKKQ